MNYYEHFMDFWFPIYHRQVFHAKFENNKDALEEILLNIIKNWNLKKEEKTEIVKKLGIYYLYQEKKEVM